MIRETWEMILQNQDVRQNLSKLRKDVKDGGERRQLLSLLSGTEEQLVKLLNHEDPKTRKNTALLMGDLGKQEYLKALYEAYEAEEQRFIRSAYLQAIKNLDYREYEEAFKEHLEQLSKAELNQDSQKHIMEEIRELTALIVKLEGVPAHHFQKLQGSYDIILLTNRNFPEITLQELKYKEPKAQAKAFGAGVRARVTNLNWVSDIRTYQELFFIVKGMATCPMDAEKAAEVIVESDLLSFLNQGHKGKPPYYFRIELKGKMDLGQKSTFLKKLSGQIEQLSKRQLINTTSHYELELRLVENKSKNYNVLLKLMTLRDDRFAYRKEVVPSSIRPTNAALTVSLVKRYMKENGQILDPFCGVGTMLIERQKSVKASTVYGIDRLEEAIEKARGNTKAAGQIVHYINRDFFDFTHEYLFDEIITDMPFKMGKTEDNDLVDLYKMFFGKAKTCLKEDGILILYSHNLEYIKENALRNGFKLLELFEISRIEGTYVVVLSANS